MTATAREFALADEGATEGLGAALAAVLRPGMLVFLRGQLGAGKTTLVRGLLRGMGHAGAVRSPTYALVESYAFAESTVHHFDLYRLVDPEELEFIGIRDFLAADALCLVEWPERGRGMLPEADMDIELVPDGVGRLARLRAQGAAGIEALGALDVK